MGKHENDCLCCRLAGEVAVALEEAADCAKFLAPLRSKLLAIADVPDFAVLPEALPPLVHTLGLIQRYSRHFSRPTRLLPIVRRVANVLIIRAKSFVPGNISRGTQNVLET